jgi:hypothetical protein
MKQTLLFLFFAFFTANVYGQLSSSMNDGTVFSQPTAFAKQTKITIYPNPATSFISVDNDTHIKQINVFNLVGRKLKTFQDIEKDEQYDVTDLPSGMYLIQVLDSSNKIITTQRINKR